MLRDHVEAMRENQELKKQKAAEKAAKAAKKNKRKITDAVDDDEDIEMENADVEPKGTKMRKKDADGIVRQIGLSWRLVIWFHNRRYSVPVLCIRVAGC